MPSTKAKNTALVLALRMRDAFLMEPDSSSEHFKS